MRRQRAVEMVGLGALVVALAVMGMGASRALAAEGDQAWLGVYTQTLSPELREGLGYNGEGALVSRVVADSPAGRAGVRKGDVIVGLNTTNVTTSSGLARAVRAVEAGKTVSLRIIRDGSRRTLSVKLAAQPADDDERFDFETPQPPEPPDAPEPPEAPQPPHMRHFEYHGDSDSDSDSDSDFVFEGIGPGLNMLGMGRGRLGVRVESLNPDLAGYFGLKDGKGALILEVLKDTPAERAGLKAGDVVTRAGDRAVLDAEDLVKALHEREKNVTLTVVRKGATRTIESELRDAPRTIRIRRDGPLGMGMRDGGLRGNDSERDDADVKRQLEELRRELRELRDRLKELDRN